MLEQEMENYDNAFELNDDSLLFDLLDQLHQRNVQTLWVLRGQSNSKFGKKYNDQS
jgi:hypothetical protein